MDSVYTSIKRAQEGDTEAKAQIVQENAGLVWSVVKRFRGRCEPDDLFQIGNIGLLKSIEKFDFSYDVKFSTYAVPMIIGEIRRFLRDDGSVKVSRSLKELSYKAKLLQETIQKTENREVSIAELAERLMVEKEELILALESAQTVESLHAEAGGEEGDTRKRIDSIPSDFECETMLEHISLRSVMEKLDEKERDLITLRYFQDKTQMEVAKIMNISQVQVSRTEKKILNKMREKLQ